MKRIFLPVSTLFASTLVGSGLVFFTQVVVARQLSLEDFGVFSVALSIVSLFIPLSGFGVSQFLLREFSREGLSALKYVMPSLWLVTILISFSIFIIFLWALFGPHEILLKQTLMFMSGYVLGQVFAEVVAGKFQLEESYMKLSLWQLTPSVTRFLMLLILFSYSFVTLLDVVFVFLGVSVLLIIISIPLLYQFSLGKINLIKYNDINLSNKNFSKDIKIIDIIRGAWPFGLAGVFYLIYFQSDIILIKYMIGNKESGMYSMVSMVITVFMLFPGVVFQRFLLPKIHRWSNHNKILFYKVYKYGSIIMLAFGLIAMIFIWFLGADVMLLLYGVVHIESISLLNILSISIPILFVSSSLGSVMVTQDNMAIKVRLMGIVAIINIVSNIFLIPIYGINGAAIATVFSYTLLFSLYFFFSINFMKKNIV